MTRSLHTRWPGSQGTSDTALKSGVAWDGGDQDLSYELYSDHRDLSIVCDLHELLRSSFGLLILGLIKWRTSVVMIMPSVTYNIRI